MSNESSPVFVCPPKSDSLNASLVNANLFAYNILPYPYLVFGVIGHARFLYVCYKQSKTESAYLLQTFFSTVRAMEIISFMLLVFAFNRWASAVNDGGAQWYRCNWLLMRFAAHLCIPLANGFINTSMLMAVCIALDRSLAIGAPHSYRNKWQHKKYRVGALATSLFIGFSVVAYDAGRLSLAYDNVTQLYTMEDNFEYQNSAFGVVFTVLRNFVDFGGVAVLIACNIVVIRLYRQKMMKTISTSSDNARSLADIEREAKRKEAQRTLFMLSLCQGIVAMLSMGFMVFLYMAQYTTSEEQRCNGILDLGWPMCDAGLQLAALLDFYLPIFISKSLRRIVFPWFVKENKTTLFTVSQTQPSKTASSAVRHQ